MRLTARLTGLNDVFKALEELEAKATRAGVRKGVTEASSLIVNAARARLRENGSVDTKSLIRAIGKRIKSYRQGRAVAGVIGARVDEVANPRARNPKDPAKLRKFSGMKVRRGAKAARRVVPANYVHLVEFGTAPHAVGRGSSTRKGSAAGGMHPGAKPHPFLRPAWDDTRTAVLELIKARVREEIAAMASRSRVVK